MSSGKWRPFCLGFHVLRQHVNIYWSTVFIRVALDEQDTKIDKDIIDSNDKSAYKLGSFCSISL